MFPDIWPGYQGMSEPYLPVPPQSVSGLDLSLIISSLSVTLRFYCFDAGLQVISKSTEVIDHPLKIPWDPVVLGSTAKLTQATDFWVETWRNHRPAGFQKLPMCSCWVYLYQIYLCKNDLVQSLRIHIFPFEKRKYPLIQIWLFSNPDTRHILWMSKAPYDAMFAYVSLHRCSQWESPGGVKCLIQDTFPDFFNMLRLGTRWSRAFSLGFVCGFRRYHQTWTAAILLCYGAVDVSVCCTQGERASFPLLSCS